MSVHALPYRYLLLFAALMLAAPWSLAAQEEAASDAAASPPAVKEAAEADAPDVAKPADTRPADDEDKPLVVYPDDRPEWVEAPPMKDGEVDRIAVSSGPHYSLGEARRQLEEAVVRAADEYVDRHLGVNDASRYIHYEAAPVKTYEERPQFSFGPMYQAHAQLEFDEAFRRQVEQDWKEALTLSRLIKTGLGVGAVFLLLSVLLGYLKADNATRGFYTRRLRLGAATVILALAAVVYFAIRFIPWV